MFNVKRVVMYPCLDASGRVTRKAKVQPKVRAIPTLLWLELSNNVAAINHLRVTVLVKLTFPDVSIQRWVECLLVVLALLFQHGWEPWVAVVVYLHHATTWWLRQQQVFSNPAIASPWIKDYPKLALRRSDSRYKVLPTTSRHVLGFLDNCQINLRHRLDAADVMPQSAKDKLGAIFTPDVIASNIVMRSKPRVRVNRIFNLGVHRLADAHLQLSRAKNSQRLSVTPHSSHQCKTKRLSTTPTAMSNTPP